MDPTVRFGADILRLGQYIPIHDDRRSAMAAFGVGSALTALSGSLPVLVVGRAVQGLGGGALVPLTLALAADLYPTGDDVGAQKKLARWLGRSRPLDYAGVARAVAPWQPYAGLVYFHLLLHGLSLAGTLESAPPQAPMRPERVLLVR